VNAACHLYQEKYELAGPQGEQCQLRIAYNGRNIVTALHISDPAHWPLLAHVASECIVTNAYSSEARALLRSARSRLGCTGWNVVSATETAHKLAVTVARSQRERVSIEIYFDKQGLASSLRPLQSTNAGLLEEIKGALL